MNKTQGLRVTFSPRVRVYSDGKVPEQDPPDDIIYGTACTYRWDDTQGWIKEANNNANN